MAAQQFTVELTPQLDALKKDVVVSTPLVDPTANQVWAGFGTTVPTRRGNEIVNGITYLINGVRDRKLLEAGVPDFKGNSLVSAVSIDAIQDSNRRTASGIIAVVVLDDDLVIGIGDAVTALQYRNLLDNAFEVVLRALQEFLYKNG